MPKAKYLTRNIRFCPECGQRPHVEEESGEVIVEKMLDFYRKHKESIITETIPVRVKVGTVKVLKTVNRKGKKLGLKPKTREKARIKMVEKEVNRCGCCGLILPQRYLKLLELEQESKAEPETDETPAAEVEEKA